MAQKTNKQIGQQDNDQQGIESTRHYRHGILSTLQLAKKTFGQQDIRPTGRFANKTFGQQDVRLIRHLANTASGQQYFC